MQRTFSKIRAFPAPGSSEGSNAPLQSGTGKF